MSWLLDLYETYEKNGDQVGKLQKKGENREYMLLPVSHSTQAAQIEVIVDTDGNFYDAKVVEKQEAVTVIPCTEASFSRTSKAVPHPLHDKLMYVAGDFERYGGVIKKDSPFNDYMEQLREWCESPYAHPKVKAIYHYLQKGTLIQDLIAKSILYVGEHHQLIKKWTKTEEEQYGDKPDIFKEMSDTQDKVFVRFDVHEVGKVDTKKVWNDKSVYDSFIAYYKGKLSEDDFCYVTGEIAPKTDRHASKIRHAADMAKLISGNDTAGFTFRGRFINANDVANISFDVSQKAHNALKWLILKQGKIMDGRVFLVWGNESVDIPSPQDDLNDLFEELGISNDLVLDAGDQTHEVFAHAVNKAFAGYKSDLSYKSKVILLILDAATPGRLSVMYYRSLNASDYFDRLTNWSKTCSWLHAYRRDEDKKFMRFYGPPVPRDIAIAAYGPHASDKVIKGLMESIMPCIVDEQKIPLNIIRSAVARASNPVSMEEWEWEKTLSITCALLKKHYEREEYDVSLDANCKERDYLFGRLLAIADVLERHALSAAGEKRATNAIRYMNAFSRHPVRAWEVIQEALQPYQAKLGNQVLYFNRLIDEVATNISLKDFNDKPLSGVYLLGFYSQRHELYKSNKDKENEQLEHKNL